MVTFLKTSTKPNFLVIRTTKEYNSTNRT